jgi:hypothetical protein
VLLVAALAAKLEKAIEVRFRPVLARDRKSERSKN